MRRAHRRWRAVRSGGPLALVAGGLLALMLVAPPSQARIKPFPPEEITNFRLGPEYAKWLVGPVAHIASAQERREYLALADDAAAAEFIEAFWERRGPNLVFPPTGPKVTFDTRAEQADLSFTEGTYLGRRTDRGTVYVLYGPPASIEYATSPTGMGPPVEIWNYPKRAEPGLDGKRPDRRYGFRPQGQVTRFFSLAGVKKLRRTPGPRGFPQ